MTAQKPHVFMTRRLPQKALLGLSEIVDLDIWEESSPPPVDILAKRMLHAEGLVSMLTDPISADLLEHSGGNLKVISQMAVGYDNIDLVSATLRHIPVGHTPGVLTDTTADFAWALLMAAARRVVEADREVHRGIWRPWGPEVLCGVDIHGATLGIVGLGRIGQAMARRARGFDMEILYTDQHQNPAFEKELGLEFVSLDELLTRSDFVSLHVFLSPETKGLIGAQQLQKMKSTAVLINTARGPVVDSTALAEALRTHTIAAAGLDVFDPEPIPSGHALLSLPNAIITPHIASASVHTRLKMAQMTIENLLAGLEGKRLPYCANPDVYKD